MDSYVAEIDELTEELDKLSRLPSRQFWSTVCLDSVCQSCLVESIQNLPRLHEFNYLIHQFKFPTKKISKILKSVLIRIIGRREIKGIGFQSLVEPLSHFGR